MAEESLPVAAVPRVSAGVVSRDAGGRVLLVEPTYKDGWEVPGGYVEPGESPLDGAVRELWEELGVPVRPGRLLTVDWAPRDGEGDKLLFLFACGPLPVDGMTFRDGEIGAARYHDPDQLDVLTPARLARRIRHALAVLDHGADPYAEHGLAVAPG